MIEAKSSVFSPWEQLFPLSYGRTTDNLLEKYLLSGPITTGKDVDVFYGLDYRGGTSHKENAQRVCSHP